MKKINEGIILASMFIILIYFVRALINLDITTILLCISLFLTLNIFKLFKVRVCTNLKTTFYVFFFLSAILGSLMNLYKYIWFYDILMHFISGVIVIYLAFYILSYFDIKIHRFNLIFAISFSLGIALSWELFEFFIDILLNLDTQKVLSTGINDTMEDVISAILGSFMYLIYKKYIHKNNEIFL